MLGGVRLGYGDGQAGPCMGWCMAWCLVCCLGGEVFVNDVLYLYCTLVHNISFYLIPNTGVIPAYPPLLDQQVFV